MALTASSEAQQKPDAVAMHDGHSHHVSIVANIVAGL